MGSVNLLKARSKFYRQMKIFWLLLILSTVCLAEKSELKNFCENSSINPSLDSSYVNGQWYEPEITLGNNNQPIGVYLVVHGLNLKPEVMKDLIDLLLSKNFAVYNLTLTGHGSSYADFQNVTAEKWLVDIQQAYCEIKKVYPKFTPNYLGYSLGGLGGVTFAGSHNQAVFGKMILIAPALSTRWYTHMLKPISFLRHINFALLGMTPEKYRSFTFTPLQAYYALGELLKKLKSITNTEIINTIPTYVFYHQDDELVSTSGLKDWISNQKLSNWKVIEIKAKLNIKHLLIVKDEFREEEWEVFAEEILGLI
jgi:alpha-beta hydrolase superfamily lysophospholipase